MITRRTAFLGCLLIELLCVFGLFITFIMRVSSGMEVTLKTVPVDPRSLFRGDYVALDYEVGRGAPTTSQYNKPVYVVLAQKGDSAQSWERVSFHDTKPELKAGEVCLLGRMQYQRISFPDIAQYFVEEGLGKELEQARNAHRLLVTASITKDCHAVITGIILGEEAPLETQPEAPFATRPILEDSKPVEVPVQ